MIEEFSLDTILTFGKHEGAMIEDLIEDDPDYVAWMSDQEFNFDEKAIKLMEDKKII